MGISKNDDLFMRNGFGLSFVVTGFFLLFYKVAVGILVILFGLSLFSFLWDAVTPLFKEAKHRIYRETAVPILLAVLAIIAGVATIERPPVQNTAEYVAYIDEQAKDDSKKISVAEVREDVEYIRDNITSFAYNSETMKELLTRAANLKYYSMTNNSVLLADIAINTTNAVEDIYIKKEAVVNNELIKRILSDCDMYLS